MKNIVLKSPSKVNLFLKVGKKIKNRKFHQIQSLIFLTNLSDEIKINKINKSKDKVKFIGKFKNSVKNKNNSVTKSLSLLRKKKLISPKIRYEIIVKKNIPAFSGLGGGSGNAATIIKYFLKKKKITENIINYFSKKLGTDFKVFFKSNKIFQEGFSKINKFSFDGNFYLLIIFPFLKCSTKEIYNKLQDYEVIRKKQYNKKISKLELINKLKFENNSLERVVTNKFPVVERILSELDFSENCEFSRVTGSGSACFGLFLNKRHGTNALKRIKKIFPRFWCALCKTI